MTQCVFDALVRGDLEEVIDHLDDDVIWYVAPPIPFAGEHVGKENVSRVLLEEFGPLFQSFERRVVELVEQTDGRYAGIIETRAEIEGVAVSSKNVHVNRIERGAIVEWWCQPLDEGAAERFWSAISS